jgi:glyoxylase-like metal-dependent hydrolase (beta-lactamase superfamily II)
MRKALLLATLLITAGTIVPAQTKMLRTQVYTSPPMGISVTSTLVFGDKDAILVDPQFLLSEAQEVAEMVRSSKRNLLAIYSTHAHPDHYFGLAVMKPAFPSARLIALPSVVPGIRNGWEGRYKNWTATYGADVPAPPAIVPEELTATSMMLEGQEIQFIGGIQGDGPNNSFVWIPSIRTIIGGDIIFSGVHFGVPSGDNRTAWLKSLDQIAALKPAVVIPGHQVPGAKNDATVIEAMRKYMQDWDAAVTASKTADEIVARMRKIYPAMGMENLMINGAAAAIKARVSN